MLHRTNWLENAEPACSLSNSLFVAVDELQGLTEESSR